MRAGVPISRTGLGSIPKAIQLDGGSGLGLAVGMDRSGAGSVGKDAGELW